MGKGGYVSRQQPDDRPVKVLGPGFDAQPDNFIDGNGFTPPAGGVGDGENGSNPSYSMPEFANGPDVRKTYVAGNR